MDTNAPGTPPPIPPPPSDLIPGAPLSPTAAVRAGWRVFAARPGASLLTWLLFYVVLVIGEVIPLVNVVFLFLAAPALTAGAGGWLLSAVRGERPESERVFDGFRRWSSATGAVLLMLLVQIALMIPFVVVAIMTGAPSTGMDSSVHGGTTPAAFINLLLVLCPLLAWGQARTAMVVFAVMEPDRPSAMTAFQRTWDLTRGNVWRLIGLFLLGFPVALLGLLAFGVGIIPAIIVMSLAWAHAYEQLRARRGAPAASAAA
jgi:uncharacterized membrane protein